jgi:hypothetical protein
MSVNMYTNYIYIERKYVLGGSKRKSKKKEPHTKKK